MSVLPPSSEATNHELKKASKLALSIQSKLAENIDLNLYAEIVTEYGRQERDLGVVRVLSGTVSDHAIDTERLRLPTREQNWSGSLRIGGRFVHQYGRYDEAKAIHVAFHPTEGGWQMYDDAAKQIDSPVVPSLFIA